MSALPHNTPAASDEAAMVEFINEISAALAEAVGKAIQIAAQNPPTTRKLAQKTKEAIFRFADEQEALAGPGLTSQQAVKVNLLRSIASGIDGSHSG